jgi:hypothetical protein
VEELIIPLVMVALVAVLALAVEQTVVVEMLVDLHQ